MATDEQKQVAVNKLEALNKSIDDFLNSKDNQVAQVFQLVEKYTRVPRKYIFLGKAVATFHSPVCCCGLYRSHWRTGSVPHHWTRHRTHRKPNRLPVPSIQIVSRLARLLHQLLSAYCYPTGAKPSTQ